MLHMPPSLAVMALDLVLIIHPPCLLLIVCGCFIILITTLPLGVWAMATGILIVFSLILVGSQLLGFLWCILGPFNSGH